VNKKIIYIFTETARACFQQPIYKQGKSNFKVDYHSRNTATSAKKANCKWFRYRWTSTN